MGIALEHIGFNKYEWRMEQNDSKTLIRLSLRTEKPEWTPKNKGKVLLWDEQGIGDKILFASLSAYVVASSISPDLTLLKSNAIASDSDFL